MTDLQLIAIAFVAMNLMHLAYHVIGNTLVFRWQERYRRRLDREEHRRARDDFDKIWPKAGDAK